LAQIHRIRGRIAGIVTTLLWSALGCGRLGVRHPQARSGPRARRALAPTRAPARIAPPLPRRASEELFAVAAAERGHLPVWTPPSHGRHEPHRGRRGAFPDPREAPTNSLSPCQRTARPAAARSARAERRAARARTAPRCSRTSPRAARPPRERPSYPRSRHDQEPGSGPRVVAELHREARSGPLRTCSPRNAAPRVGGRWARSFSVTRRQ